MSVGLAGSDVADRLDQRSGTGRSRAALVAVLLVGITLPALAQTAAPASPPVTADPLTVSSFGPQSAATMKTLLENGYEIKTGILDPNGGAYIALQKATSAYLCHSNPTPLCEKLN